MFLIRRFMDSHLLQQANWTGIVLSRCRSHRRANKQNENCLVKPLGTTGVISLVIKWLIKVDSYRGAGIWNTLFPATDVAPGCTDSEANCGSSARCAEASLPGCCSSGLVLVDDVPGGVWDSDMLTTTMRSRESQERTRAEIQKEWHLYSPALFR